MKSKLTLLMLSSILLLECGAAEPANPDERAVLAAVNGYLAGFSARDQVLMRDNSVAGGTAAGVGCGPEGKFDSIFLKSIVDYIKSTDDYPPNQLERLIEPEIRIDGNLASVWGRYEYSVDGEIQHRGFASYEVARVNGVWKVLNHSWSTQRNEC